MRREEAIKRMRDNWGQISSFGVRSLALFGSLARDETGSDSDADILVEFRGPATFDCYMDLKIFLEELLGCPVDLVTRKAIKPRMRTYVEEEAIYVP
jgi:predicted nucleotidyltransferase